MNLKVKIPKKFKNKLSERFDFKQAQRWGPIDSILKKLNTKCSLCEVYFSIGCMGCPFEEFKEEFKTEQWGCHEWINRVLLFRSFDMVAGIIVWKESRDKEVKEQLSLLRKKAKELIEWV